MRSPIYIDKRGIAVVTRVRPSVRPPVRPSVCHEITQTRCGNELNLSAFVLNGSFERLTP